MSPIRSSAVHGLTACLRLVLLVACSTTFLHGRAAGQGAPGTKPTNAADASTPVQVERDGTLVTPPAVRTGEGLPETPTGGLIAYSLKAAQARLLASDNADDWRRHDPGVFTLGGITRPEGLVVDRKSRDIILVGRAVEGDAPLTLDDFVLALRARLNYGKWPLVSIDPPPSGAIHEHEGDPQPVRFEGGIQNTQFGADLLDADHRLKRMGFGLLPLGVPNLSSQVERIAAGNCAAPGTNINERFWFEPVEDRVIVRDDVVQLGPMSVSVFTQVLSVSINGTLLDPNTYHDATADAFAADISNHFDEVARANPTIARVRGLNGMVAVVAGLERISDTPSLSYWQSQYRVRTVQTPSTARVLQVSSNSPLCAVIMSGGVELQAIALALQSGDVSALRRAVLLTRPQPTALSWRLVIGQWVVPLSRGALPTSALGPLFAQAAFLEQQKRWDDELAILNATMSLRGSDKEALPIILLNRGAAYAKMDQNDRAIEDFNRAIQLNPNYAAAYNNRGAAYEKMDRHDRAIEDFNRAIQLNPNYASPYNNRGVAYDDMGQYERAIKDYSRAIQFNPNYASVYEVRGAAYYKMGQQHHAIDDYGRAIQLNPNDADTYNNRGVAYYKMNQYERAIEDYSRAIQLNPNDADTYVNRAAAYFKKGQYNHGIQDCNKAILLNPNEASAYHNRGTAYDRMGQHNRAIEDYGRAIQLNPNYP